MGDEAGLKGHKKGKSSQIMLLTDKATATEERISTTTEA